MAFDEVTEALREYEAKVAEKGGTAPRRLRPGLTREDAQRIAAGYDVTLTEDALAVWMWHDGEGTVPYCPGYRDKAESTSGIFAGVGFPPLSVAFQLAERMCALWEWGDGDGGYPTHHMKKNDVKDYNGGTSAMCLWDIPLVVYDADLPQTVIDSHDSEVKDSLALPCDYGYVDPSSRTVLDFVRKEIDRLEDGTYTVNEDGILL